MRRVDIAVLVLAERGGYFPMTAPSEQNLAEARARWFTLTHNSNVNASENNANIHPQRVLLAGRDIAEIVDSTGILHRL